MVVTAEEGIGLRVDAGEDVECVLMRDADVVVKDVEAVIGVLSDPCLPPLLFLLLVDGFLDEFVDIGVVGDIDFLRLEDGPY